MMEASLTQTVPDVRPIPLLDIWIGERRRKEMGDLTDLAEDIRENGLLQFPNIRPPNEVELELGITQPWVLMTGGRRVGAAFALGWQTIPCSILATASELQSRIWELHENIKRKQMTFQEEAFAMQEIVRLRQEQAKLEGRKITQAQVAAELRMSPSEVSRSVAAAEAMQKNPGLKKAGSRKAVLRAAEQEKHVERLTVSEVMAKQDGQLMQVLQNTVVTADARDWIRKVPGRSVNLILTDPPWGIDYFSGGQKTEHGKSHAKYDDSLEATKDLLTDLVPQWLRVLRETGWIISFLGEESYDFVKDLVSNCCAEHCDYRNRLEKRCLVAIEENSSGCRFLTPEIKPWIWVRPNSQNKPRYPERHTQNLYEKMLVVNGGKARLNYHCTNVLTFDAVYGDERFHPNQKPVELTRELVRRTCNIGDTVIDPFFGSGSHLAGAASLACIVEGCDTNEAMRGPALGFIMKHRVPTPSRARQISEERYHSQMERVAVGIEDFTETEESA